LGRAPKGAALPNNYLMKKYITPRTDEQMIASLTIMAASYQDPSKTSGGNTGQLSAPKRNVF